MEESWDIVMYLRTSECIYKVVDCCGRSTGQLGARVAENFSWDRLSGDREPKFLEKFVRKVSAAFIINIAVMEKAYISLRAMPLH